MPRPKICRTCSKEAHKKCFGCNPKHRVRYCNIECQRADWPKHRRKCVRNDERLKQINIEVELMLRTESRIRNSRLEAQLTPEWGEERTAELISAMSEFGFC